MLITGEQLRLPSGSRATCQASYTSCSELPGMKLTAVFGKAAEGYIGFVEELPGANTQGRTPDAAKPLPHGLVYAAYLITVSEESARPGYTRTAPSCTETLNEPRKGSVRIFYRLGGDVEFRVLHRRHRQSRTPWKCGGCLRQSLSI